MRGERGSAGVGLATGGFALVLLLLLSATGLRIVDAEGRVAGFGRATARAAAAAGNEAQARAEVELMARRSLDRPAGPCTTRDVDLRGDWSPGGQVVVTVRESP